GTADLGWLQSRHTFSFADYQNPERINFGPLRVINEDWIAAGKGFNTHPHENMEIITYMLDGELEHKDSMGNGSIIRPGDVQRMTAGTGVRHSEFNQSKNALVHFLQIWILPEKEGLKPGYEQKTFGEEEKRRKLRLVGSRDGRGGSVTIHQDVDLYATRLGEGDETTHQLGAGRKGWVQVARGRAEINGMALQIGDGVALADETGITLRGMSDAEILLFDMSP
ncbi:MAG: pirin family protein, partial [Gammaproteobacteria bacterium]|nr:pirin family protein [Gammaproteobacteria bacterium]MDX2462326.1 pirin family protein [Gammaproteobacteria bacterium]